MIFLFTDGEEIQTMGARAFAGQHPWARDVAVTIVYEGYGSTGADVLYGTSRDAGWLAAQALSAGGPAAGLAGYSFLNAIMGLMGGSSSDMETLVSGGAPGLAFISFSLATAPSYHTWDDNVANFDPRTLQSHGDHAVALLRHFGDMTLAGIPREPDAVYFSLLPGVTIHYPGAAALPLAIGALVLFAAVLVLGLRQRRLSVPGVLAGVFGWLLSLLASLATTTLVETYVRRLNPNLRSYRVGGLYDAQLYLLAFIALAVAITWAVYATLGALARRRFTPSDLTAGALAWWALLGVLLALGLPGLSYVLTWPLFAALLVAGWSFLRPAPAQPDRSQAAVGWAVLATGGLTLSAPLIYFLAVLAGRLEGIMGIPGAGLPLLFVLLLLGLLLPLLDALAGHRPGWVAGGALALCLALLVIAGLRSAPSPAHPATNTVVYHLETSVDGDSQASWITVNDSRGGRGTRGQLDAWTAQFFPDGAQEAGFNPWTNGWMNEMYPVLQAPAPVESLQHGALTVEADERSAGLRRMRLHLALAPQTLDGQILLDAAGPLGDVTANGLRIDVEGAPGDSMHLNFYGGFDDGITLQFSVPVGEAPAERRLSVTLNERTLGLPSVPGLAVEPRPATMIPAPFNSVADSTLATQSWQFAP